MRALALSLLFSVAMVACSQESSNQNTAVESGTAPVEEIVASVETLQLTVPAAVSNNDNPVVVIETNLGAVTAELWADRAPISTENFLRYVDSNFFDGLVFHRVIPGFMIQGGGYAPDLTEKSTFEPIRNEARADARNNRGTLAMARTNVVDSATSQFFINLVDNTFLNHTDETPQGFGYAVFGEVISGMETVDAIAAVATGPGRFGHQNVPVEPVVINSVRRAP